MKIYLYLIACLLVFSSCVSVINDKYVRLNVYTTEPAVITCEGNQYKTEDNTVSIQVRRKKAPVELELVTDSLVKQISVSSKLSAGLLLDLYPGFLLSFIPDLTSSKRFTYPYGVLIDTRDTLNVFRKYDRYDKRDAYYYIGLPLKNGFYFKPDHVGAYRSDFGFLGLRAGVDDYIRSDLFIRANVEINAKGLKDFRLWERNDSPIDFYSWSCSISIRKDKGLYNFGAGLHHSWNVYSDMTNVIIDPTSSFVTSRFVTYRSRNIGFDFGAAVRLNSSLHLEVSYRPTLFQYKPRVKHLYEHTVSIGFLWRSRNQTRPFTKPLDE